MVGSVQIPVMGIRLIPLHMNVAWIELTSRDWLFRATTHKQYKKHPQLNVETIQSDYIHLIFKLNAEAV